MSVYKTFGDVAREKGATNEHRLLEIVLKLKDTHHWVEDARLATPEEDARGIDLVVTTDLGPLYLNAKSSRMGAQKHQDKQRPTLIEAVVVHDDEAMTRRRLLHALTTLRGKVRTGRT